MESGCTWCEAEGRWALRRGTERRDLCGRHERQARRMDERAQYDREFPDEARRAFEEAEYAMRGGEGTLYSL